METIEQIRLAKQAKKSINTATSDEKNKALRAMADSLVEATDEILAANQLDMEAARGRISEVMLDRLLLTEERIQAMADGIQLESFWRSGPWRMAWSFRRNEWPWESLGLSMKVVQT